MTPTISNAMKRHPMMLRRSFKWQFYPTLKCSWHKEFDSDYGWSDCWLCLGPIQMRWKTYR